MPDHPSRRPYPGQDYKHGWQPVTPKAVIEKNHGRKPSPGTEASEKHKAVSKRADDAIRSMAKQKRTRATPKQAAPKPAAEPSPTKGATAPTKGKAFIDNHYREWKDGLSPGQEKAMRFYQSPGFALMNGQLRGLDKSSIKADVSFNDADLERARKASKDLAAAIRKAPPLNEPMTVYRGFSADQFGDLKPGQTFSDKGFTSTSLTDDVGSVGKAARQATSEIVLPKGAKAAAGSSRELVLPPGSKFKVLSAGTRKGVPHYRLELVL